MKESLMNLISVVVPCYNEEKAIPIFYKEFKDRTQRITGKGYSFEFVFVDDGSSDGTLEEIKKIQNVTYVSFSRNFGKEAAILAGIKKARGNYVAIMDVDLQDPPELINEMLDEIINNGYDCVAAYRSSRKGEPKTRSFFANRFYQIINSVSEVKIVNGARDFRLMKRCVVDAVLKMSEKNRFSKGLFNWVGFKTKWIGYENINRSVGNTKWSFWELTKYALEGFFAFSDVLLKIPIIFSIIFLICAIVFLILGFYFGALCFISSLICLISALLFFTFWVFGEYVSKLNKEIRNRPSYIIRQETDDIKDSKE